MAERMTRRPPLYQRVKELAAEGAFDGPVRTTPAPAKKPVDLAARIKAMSPESRGRLEAALDKVIGDEALAAARVDDNGVDWSQLYSDEAFAGYEADYAEADEWDEFGGEVA